MFPLGGCQVAKGVRGVVFNDTVRKKIFMFHFN